MQLVNGVNSVRKTWSGLFLAGVSAEMQRDELLFRNGGDWLTAHDAHQRAAASQEDREEKSGSDENAGEGGDAEQQTRDLRRFGNVAFGMIDGDVVVEANLR